MQQLVIVESPTKAKTLARFLGNNYRVEASMGHVRDLPKGELGVDVDSGFVPHYIVPKDKKTRVEELKKIAKGSDIYLATDPDREGEAIAWHISQLLSGNGKHKRIVFHEITEHAIRESLQNPRGIDQHLVDAQQARRVLDRLVGYKLSPLLWRKVRKGLSAGRVQSVALRLVVEREREVIAFKPLEYWLIDILLLAKEEIFGAQVVSFKKKKLTIETKDFASRIAAELKSLQYVVGSVTKRTIRRQPDAPFTTSTLQQTAANRLGFSAKRTMLLAQKLYEEGYITYMRTDSVNLASEAIAKARLLIERSFGGKYLPKIPRIFKTKQKLAQEAHEAIRPTEPSKEPTALKDELDRDRLKLYTLIWQRMIAAQMSEAVYDQVTIEITAGDFGLRAGGRTIAFEGWLKVLQDAKDEKEDSRKIPELAVSEQVTLKEISPSQHFTEPPPRYSEASLIKALEEQGIGRPSTYAPILSTLQDRQYVEIQDRRLSPTSLGIAVSDFLVKYFPIIMDIRFTAGLEDQLDGIAKGESEWTPIIEHFYVPFEKHLETVQDTAERVKIEVEETDEECPQCHKKLVVRLGRFGKFLACSGFPECKFTKQYFKKLGILCPKCGGEIIMRRTKKKKSFYGCSNYPKCDFASWTKPKFGQPLAVLSA